VKQCTKCQRPLPLDQFPNASRVTVGKRSVCKDCTNAANRATYRRNREAHQATKRKWKQDNRAAYLAQQQQAYATDHVNQRKIRNDRRQANLEQYRQIELAYHKANPEVWSNASAKRRARKINAPVVENVDRRVVYDRDGGVCYLCENKVNFEEMHAEHVIPLARGGNHSYDNVKTACADCNLRKGMKTPEEFAVTS
jgi:5-methylcytosine-specific restriction endonuclease McrA